MLALLRTTGGDMSITEQIRNSRKPHELLDIFREKKISQSDLSAFSHIPYTVLNAYLNGRLKMPAHVEKKLRHIAKLL